jgi:hypothetical protein
MEAQRLTISLLKPISTMRVSALSANLSRRVLLLIWMPLIALSYFGTLTMAAWYCGQGYDWRRNAISKLLYPGYDPQFHYVASLGVALAGLLMFPLGGYIRRKMPAVSERIVDGGAFALQAGAIGLMLAGLIVSHPAHGTSALPWLHEILARAAAFALGAGMLALWTAAAKAHFVTSPRNRPSGCLLLSWSLITLPALSIALLRAIAGTDLNWSNPIYQALRNRALWQLGFWEWIGSAAVFLFLLSAVLFLPE